LGRKERTSFLKKKKQKTFTPLAAAFPATASPDWQSFLVLFFKKERLPYYLQSPWEG
jgi:hypothetical protein